VSLWSLEGLGSCLDKVFGFTMVGGFSFSSFFSDCDFSCDFMPPKLCLCLPF